MTQRILLRSGRLCKRFSGSSHAQRLVRTPVVVKVDPVADQAAGVLRRFEAVAMHALLLERADHALDQAVLLEAVRRDELLSQAVAPDQGGEVATGEHPAIV